MRKKDCENTLKTIRAYLQMVVDGKDIIVFSKEFENPPYSYNPVGFAKMIIALIDDALYVKNLQKEDMLSETLEGVYTKYYFNK